MILQNAEGVKNNLLLESRCRTKQCHSGWTRIVCCCYQY
jgi:hypothetical protein